MVTIRSKEAVILLSGEDEHAKALHALLYALDLNEHGVQANLFFDGAGTAWLRKFESDGDLRQLFEEAQAKGLVGTACNYCAHAFKSIDQAEALHVKLSPEGTRISVGELAKDGYGIITV